MWEWLSPIDVVTAEDGRRVAQGDVVVVWYDLKLCEPNTVVEFCTMRMIDSVRMNTRTIA